VARRATIIKEERAASPHVLLLDAGDSLFGSQVADRTQGRSSVALMNALGYDAVVLGEADFRFGLEVLRQRMAEAEFPFLSANVVSEETAQLVAEPYSVKQIGGYKVGIVGLTSPKGAGQPISLGGLSGEKVIIRDPIETAKEVVSRVRGEADVVIVLSHLGEDMDEQLAKAVPRIDVILGGHDEQAQYPPREVSQRGTLRVAADRQGQTLGVLRLTVDGQGVREAGGSALIVLDPGVADDPEVKAMVETWKAEGPPVTPSAPRPSIEPSITPAQPALTSPSDSDDSEPPTLVIQGPEGTIPPGPVPLSWAGNDAISSPDRLTYRFRLAGTSEWEGWPPDRWSPWMTIREVTYHFPKGEYTFTVQVQDEAGNVAEAQWTFGVE